MIGNYWENSLTSVVLEVRIVGETGLEGIVGEIGLGQHYKGQRVVDNNGYQEAWSQGGRLEVELQKMVAAAWHPLFAQIVELATLWIMTSNRLPHEFFEQDEVVIQGHRDWIKLQAQNFR